MRSPVLWDCSSRFVALVENSRERGARCISPAGYSDRTLRRHLAVKTIAKPVRGMYRGERTGLTAESPSVAVIRLLQSQHIGKATVGVQPASCQCNNHSVRPSALNWKYDMPVQKIFQDE
jgi:hypothetical protein